MKTLTTFNKSVLSIVIISALTASFISWDRYQPRHETPSMTEFYQRSHFDKNELLLQSLVTNDSAVLARIAEDYLLAETDLLVESDLIAASTIESRYSPEADENVAYQTENEEVVLWQEKLNQGDINSDIIVSNRVLFDFDSSDISEKHYPSLNETAQLMKNESADKDAIWQVVGYADRSGNYIYNNKLARKRAQAVAQYLVNKGVDEQQLAVLSLGSSDPLHEVRSIENNRNERRVEIHAYQAQVTALLAQYNKQLKQSSKASVKVIELPIESTTIVDVDKQQVKRSKESIASRSFKEIQIERLTTAMEL